MDTSFSSGAIATAIVVFMVLEGLLIAFLHQRTGRGIPMLRLIPTLLAGASLMLALRGALVGAPAMELSVWLAAALVAHIWDLVVRWEGAPR